MSSPQGLRFLQGRLFNEGIRMTVGIALPAFILGALGISPAGIVFSTGALCVSITDSAGPAHHRANGMFFCVLIIALMAFLTFRSLTSHVWMVAEIVTAGFLFSMLSVYNARVSSVGIAGLLIMILCMQQPVQGNEVFYHVLLLAGGGTWYLCFSLALYRIKPYKLIQQLTGEFAYAVSEYLRTRASFYNDHPEYEAIYASLLRQQVTIETKQSSLSELLFKTPFVTKYSTPAGRALLKIYLDLSDIFENIMSAYQKYEVLHKQFDQSGILGSYRTQLILLANELSLLSAAITAGERSVSDGAATKGMHSLRDEFNRLREKSLAAKNVEHFIGLGRILFSINNLAEKISSLHYYTPLKKMKNDESVTSDQTEQFNQRQDMSAELLINNLNFKSNVFRHALRVAIALTVGYMISLFFTIGHSYWILLTVLVILKPAYGLTKARNIGRLFGTVAGLLTGAAVLLLVKQQALLLIVMMIFMAAGYMFIRTKYLASVFFTTIFLTLFFHYTSPGLVTVLLKDRFIDTLIGSAIAFLAGLLLFPAWEHRHIKDYMAAAIEKNVAYFESLKNNFIVTENSFISEKKIPRRAALTALANLSDALARMLSEPIRFRKNPELIFRFVVLNSIIHSHFATLSFYAGSQKNNFQSFALEPISNNIITRLQLAKEWLQTDQTNGIAEDLPGPDLHKITAELSEKRRAEITRGELETPTKAALIAAKSVTDQFQYIDLLSADILKNVREFRNSDFLERNADQKRGSANQ